MSAILIIESPRGQNDFEFIPSRAGLKIVDFNDKPEAVSNTRGLYSPDFPPPLQLLEINPNGPRRDDEALQFQSR